MSNTRRSPKEHAADGRTTPSTERGQRTRDEILHAAIRVFGERGFTGTTMLDIAREAGVASGTVYQYFSDKADLFRFLLRDLRDQLHRETRMPANGEGRLVVRQAVLRYLDIYRESAPLFRAWWEVLEPPTEFTEAWVNLHDKSRGELTAVIENGRRSEIIAGNVDPEITADLVVAMFERPAYLRIVMGWDEKTTDEDIVGVMEKLLGQGFLSKPTAAG